MMAQKKKANQRLFSKSKGKMKRFLQSEIWQTVLVHE